MNFDFMILWILWFYEFYEFWFYEFYDLLYVIKKPKILLIIPLKIPSLNYEKYFCQKYEKNIWSLIEVSLYTFLKILSLKITKNTFVKIWKKNTFLKILSLNYEKYF